RETFEGDPSRALPYKEVGAGIAFAGIEYYLPLFFDETATLFDYLPADSVLVTTGELDAVIDRIPQDTQSSDHFLKSDRDRPILPPERLFLDFDALHAQFRHFSRLALQVDKAHPQLRPPPDVAVQRQSADPIARLRQVVEHGQAAVLLCADSAGRRETLMQLLAEHRLHPVEVESIQAFLHDPQPFAISPSPLSSGFAADDPALLFLTEGDLFPGYTARRSKRKHQPATNVEAMVRDLSELRVGDPVVHTQHGIGRYQGLITMDLGEGEAEFMHLEYAGDANLYVPVSQLHVISRYSGADPDTAPLHQL